MNIVVTGASRGIGYQTVKHLAMNSHRVIGTARNKHKLEGLKKEKPQQIHIFPADLTDSKSVSSLIDFISETLPNVDVLINNAGSLINASFEKLDINDWRHLMEVNLFSAIRLIQSLLPYFSGTAHIVNISSMGGFQGSSKFPGLSAYSVSKGALSLLSECLAAEFADKNINVNALCLGAVETEMFKEAFPGFQAPLTAEEMGMYLADFSLNGSKYFNGKILPVALFDPE